MTTQTSVTTHTDHPVFYDADGETLFGVITRPDDGGNGIAVVMAYGGTHSMTAHRNRFFLRVAHLLADGGFTVMRFDYHGCGDSTGRVGEWAQARPFPEDLAGALEVLRDEGYERFALIGECFGARTCLANVSQIDDLAGLFLIAPMVRDGTRGEARVKRWARERSMRQYARKALSATTIKNLRDPVARRAYRTIAAAKFRHLVRKATGRRPSRRPQGRGPDLSFVSPRFLEPMRNVLARRVPVHFVFGTLDGMEDFDLAKTGELGRFIDEAGDAFELDIVEGKVHAGLTDATAQDGMIEFISAWANRLAPEPR